MIGERPNKKNIESFNLTQKVNIFRLWRGKVFFLQQKNGFNPKLVSFVLNIGFKDFLVKNNT